MKSFRVKRLGYVVLPVCFTMPFAVHLMVLSGIIMTKTDSKQFVRLSYSRVFNCAESKDIKKAISVVLFDPSVTLCVTKQITQRNKEKTQRTTEIDLRRKNKIHHSKICAYLREPQSSNFQIFQSSNSYNLQPVTFQPATIFQYFNLSIFNQ